MTEITLTTWDCKCDPNDGDQQGTMTLIIVEGNTTIWGCSHVKAHEKITTREWKIKK